MMSHTSAPPPNTNIYEKKQPGMTQVSVPFKGLKPGGPPFQQQLPQQIAPPIQFWPGGGWPGDGGGGPPGMPGPPGPPGDGGDGGGGDGDKKFALWTVDVDRFGTFEGGMQVNAENNVQQGDEDTLKQQQDEQYTAVLPCLAPGASGRVTVILPDGQKPSDGKWASSQQPCPANPSADTLEPVGQAQEQPQDQQQDQPGAAGVGQMWPSSPYALPPNAAGTHCCTGMMRAPLQAPTMMGSPCHVYGLGYGVVC